MRRRDRSLRPSTAPRAEVAARPDRAMAPVRRRAGSRGSDRISAGPALSSAPGSPGFERSPAPSPESSVVDVASPPSPVVDVVPDPVSPVLGVVVEGEPPARVVVGGEPGAVAGGSVGVVPVAGGVVAGGTVVAGGSVVAGDSVVGGSVTGGTVVVGSGWAASCRLGLGRRGRRLGLGRRGRRLGLGRCPGPHHRESAPRAGAAASPAGPPSMPRSTSPRASQAAP